MRIKISEVHLNYITLVRTTYCLNLHNLCDYNFLYDHTHTDTRARTHSNTYRRADIGLYMRYSAFTNLQTYLFINIILVNMDVLITWLHLQEDLI